MLLLYNLPSLQNNLNYVTPQNLTVKTTEKKLQQLSANQPGKTFDKHPPNTKIQNFTRSILTIVTASARAAEIISFTHQKGHSFSVYRRSSNVECIQHKYMLIVLGQCHNVSLRSNLQAATTAHFHIGTLKLANECRITLEHSNVKPVTMAVTNKDVTRITNVDSIWVVGEVFATNTAKKLPFLAEYHNTVALHNQQHTAITQ